MAWGVGHSRPSCLSGCGWLICPLSLCLGVEGLSLDVSSLVDIRDYVNKELALRIHTDIDSQGTFFTDLNGFQVISGAQALETPQNTTWTMFCFPQGTGAGVCAEREGEPGKSDEDSFRLGTFWGPSRSPDALDLLVLPHRCSPGGI